MNPALLLLPAFVLVILLGVVLVIAFRGADIARVNLDRRYRLLELKSEQRAICIRTDRRLWQAEQAAAQDEQKIRHQAKRQAIHDWSQEFNALHQSTRPTRPGIPGVRWPG